MFRERTQDSDGWVRETSQFCCGVKPKSIANRQTATVPQVSHASGGTARHQESQQEDARNVPHFIHFEIQQNK
jgi:hypothetical protein